MVRANDRPLAGNGKLRGLDQPLSQNEHDDMLPTRERVSNLLAQRLMTRLSNVFIGND